MCFVASLSVEMKREQRAWIGFAMTASFPGDEPRNDRVRSEVEGAQHVKRSTTSLVADDVEERFASVLDVLGAMCEVLALLLSGF